MKIKIGTRDSKLAMIQTELVVQAIKEYDSSAEIEIVAMKTTGDKILDKTLDKIGGKGLFVKELDHALLAGQVDITVHSFKDMPMDVPNNLPIVALSKREDPRDVLILRDCIKDESEVNIVGTSSKRREIQLKNLGFDNILPIRGNLTTRLAKLDSGEYDAIVLAAAGVVRSGLEHRISRYFSVKEIIPAACQGIIAVQARAGDNTEFLKCFDCEVSHILADTERSFVSTLNGGCSSPVACYSYIEDNMIKIAGLYADENNTKILNRDCELDQGVLIAKELAEMCTE